ncbi:hypothetical protein JYB62_03730 [Algoriphagus lutimaris]|uniref:hypothetical protein n=1 Tax=Algoriphagus lutimaris TaxID=613197 RepID=UPI00196B2630|nr:hypothetical protein [Algoriphagus lutimaris]MBN3519103.1 hypothetical protein [Algoriphagus lutimaris]
MPKIKNLDEYLKKLELLPPFQKQLSDIPNEDYKLDVVDINETLPIAAAPIQFIGSLNFGPRLFVFNDPDDNNRELEEDEHEIVKSENSQDEVLIVPNYDTNAIIQYGLGVSIKASSSNEKLGFLFSGSANVRVNTYKQHPRTYSLLKAATQDLKNFPWVFSIGELKNLKNNEACTLQFAGVLKSSLEVKWSDLYSGSLLGVSKLLNVPAPLTIEVDAGASVQFDFGIQDDFVLIIKKVSGQTYEIGVKKNKTQSFGAGAKIGINASFSEKSQGALETILQSLLENFLKKGKSEIDGILSKSRVADLIQEEQDTLTKIMETIGYTGPLDKIAEMKAAWEKYLGKIRDTITKVATAKIEAGVNFEYSQIKTEECFLLGELSLDALVQYHPDLIRLRLDGILEDQTEGVNVKKYLEDKSYQRKSGFGFDLKVNQKGLGLDFDSSIEVLTRKNEKPGYLYVSTKSAKSYEGELFGDKFKWLAGLEIATKDFVKDPKISDLGIKQHLGFEWSENKKLEKNEIYKIIDTAVLWGLINGYDREEAYQNLSSELKTKNAKNITVSLNLEIPEDTFKEIIRAMYEVKKANLNNYYSNLAYALAACIFNKNQPIRDRIEKHGKNFLSYLSTPSYRLDDSLKAYAGYINQSQIGQLNNAIDMIINRGGESFSEDSVKKIIKGFNKFHNNIYRVKVLGFLLFHFGRITGRAAEIEPSLKITYSKNNEEKVINMVQNLNPQYLNY